MKIVFMGTPDFAVPCLEKLIASEHEVAGLFCQPDRPKGRGHKLVAPPVKECALSHDIPVFQPEKVKDGTALEILKKLSPDCIVVVAYGKILPREILELPEYGCVNIHASLLPKYRGSAPIQWAVINGEKVTGVTSMQMDEGMDTGDILLTKTFEIPQNMTGGELFDALSPLGAELILPTLDGLLNKTLAPKKQNEADATKAPMLSKEFSQIDWNKPAEEIHNLIRGLNPWPCAMTFFGDTKIKLYSSEILGEANGKAGEVVKNDSLAVVCGDGKMLKLCEVQLDGSRRMLSCEMLRGHNIPAGTVLSHMIK